MKMNSLRVALFASAATVLFAANAAAAKDGPVAPADPAAAPAAAAPAPQTDVPAEGTDIIITSTKTNERQRDVPASVSVVTATDLTKQGSVRFTDYANKVPGLSLTSARTGITQIVLRGITTGSSQPGSTTGFYLDDAPIGSVNAYTGGNGITPDLDPSDLQQIEVLKGPQGTLYGAGAVGGLVRFTTAKPNLDTFEAGISGGVNTVAGGSVGYSGRGMVNIPIVKGQLGLHASGFYRYDPGYIDNINPRIGVNNVNFAKVRGGRAVLAMKLGPDVSVSLSALGQDTTTNGTNTIDVDAATLKPIYGDLKQNRFIRELGFVRLRLYNMTVRADLADNLDFVSSTTYQRISFRELGDGTRSYGAALGPLFGLGNTLGIRLNTLKHTDRWSEEARLSTKGLFGGVLDLQGGFYWTHEGDKNSIPNIDTFSTTTGATLPLPAIAIAKIDSTYEEYSFFGNARVHFGDKFDILGGIRFSHDDQKYLQDYQGLIVGPRLIVPGGETADIVTYMVSPRFKITNDIMVYGRVATGYRPGGPNPAPPATPSVPLTFQPDKLIQYEVGFKAQTSDKKLSLDAALFTTNWNNIQIQTSASGFNFLVNGGRARSTGGEATLRFTPVSGLIFGANVGYTDAKLTSAAPAAGGLNGDRLPYVPHWAGSLTADYSTPLSGDLKLNVGATLGYVGDRISDYSNKFPKRLQEYATVDLRAGFTGSKWSLTAFVRNLTDKRAILVAGQQGLAPSSTPGAFYAAGINQPRTIGAEASFKF